MITDARRLPRDCTVECDICIVGAGAAGIALAHELLDSGRDVVLLEGGGKRFESSVQDLYRGEVEDPTRHGRLDLYRQRRFGGTTGVWGGRCAPLDAIDFETRPYVPDSGWPVSKNDIDPYYVRAHKYCELGAYTYEAETALPGNAEMIPGFKSADVRTDRLWRFSPPTNFASAFRKRLETSSKLLVYLHANCLTIRLRHNAPVVDHLEIGVSADKKFKLKARQYVLAAGGLEVTRLLLVSDDVRQKGIGNEHDLVGRFYCSHVTGDIGEVALRPKNGHVIWNYERTPDHVYCRRTISISQEKQRHDHLLNFCATLSHPPYGDPRHGNGVLSSIYLVKKYYAHKIPPEYSRVLSGVAPLRHVSAHVSNIVRDPIRLAQFSNVWIRRRVLTRRKLPSAMFESKAGIYTLHIDAEQSPNAESLVTLSDDKDTFGIRRLRVSWKLRETDLKSVARSSRLLSEALERSGTGQALFRPETIEEHIWNTCSVGSHHIGTTRMADDPRKGVVDRNCRVHSTANLYIASSSVFPTTGVANPTLTIVALAIRLADHLRDLNAGTRE